MNPAFDGLNVQCGKLRAEKIYVWGVSGGQGGGCAVPQLCARDESIVHMQAGCMAGAWKEGDSWVCAW